MKIGTAYYNGETGARVLTKRERESARLASILGKSASEPIERRREATADERKAAAALERIATTLARIHEKTGYFFAIRRTAMLMIGPGRIADVSAELAGSEGSTGFKGACMDAVMKFSSGTDVATLMERLEALAGALERFYRTHEKEGDQAKFRGLICKRCLVEFGWAPMPGTFGIQYDFDRSPRRPRQPTYL